MERTDFEREMSIIQENNTLNERGIQKVYTALYQVTKNLQDMDEVDQASLSTLQIALAILNTSLTHSRNITDRINRLKTM